MALCMSRMRKEEPEEEEGVEMEICIEMRLKYSSLKFIVKYGSFSCSLHFEASLSNMEICRHREENQSASS